MNVVTLIGRLGKNIELKRTGSGTAVTNFSIAVNRDFKQDGQPDTDWINCQAWSKTAEVIDKYCHKGSMIAVTGRLQVRSYDNSKGDKVYVTEVIVNNVQFLDSKSNNQKQEQPYQNSSNNAQNANKLQQAANSTQPQYHDTVYDIMQDDIEF